MDKRKLILIILLVILVISAVLMFHDMRKDEINAEEVEDEILNAQVLLYFGQRDSLELRKRI